YQLRIRLRKPKAVRVGALGRCHFASGWYVYSGSAKNGLVQRVGRHLRHRKRLRWHIDYLLAVADEVDAFVLAGTAMSECRLHTGLRGGDAPVTGFGSSDCSCESHLMHFRRRPRVGLMLWKRFLRLCRT